MIAPVPLGGKPPPHPPQSHAERTDLFRRGPSWLRADAHPPDT
ncbi:hypothetical protein [Sphingomonas koreensis]|nr:hypothetical protein [Sphingomonas koreensis]